MTTLMKKRKESSTHQNLPVHQSPRLANEQQTMRRSPRLKNTKICQT
jgi:hypothetical protein